MNTLDLLLKADINSIKIPKKEIKIKRLSERLNGDVIFTISALSLDKLEELREANSKDFNIHTILEGVKEPNLKSRELMDKYNAVTPVELVKRLLLPGEIEDVYLAISKLSGYGINTIEEIKKK